MLRIHSVNCIEQRNILIFHKQSQLDKGSFIQCYGGIWWKLTMHILFMVNSPWAWSTALLFLLSVRALGLPFFLYYRFLFTGFSGCWFFLDFCIIQGVHTILFSYPKCVGGIVLFLDCSITFTTAIRQIRFLAGNTGTTKITFTFKENTVQLLLVVLVWKYNYKTLSSPHLSCCVLSLIGNRIHWTI